MCFENKFEFENIAFACLCLACALSLACLVGRWFFSVALSFVGPAQMGQVHLARLEPQLFFLALSFVGPVQSGPAALAQGGPCFSCFSFRPWWALR